VQNKVVSDVKKEWGTMLDDLCGHATAEEEVIIRQMASSGGGGPPTHLVPLHDYLAGLLVKYGVTTWQQMRTRFTGGPPTWENSPASLVFLPLEHVAVLPLHEYVAVFK
jgi:hypothetical protein